MISKAKSVPKLDGANWHANLALLLHLNRPTHLNVLKPTHHHTISISHPEKFDIVYLAFISNLLPRGQISSTLFMSSFKRTYKIQFY